MAKITVAAILKRLDAKGASVLELLRLYNNEAHRVLWQQDARLYIAFTRRLLGAGHPARAFETAREGLTIHPQNHDLQYWRSLSLARGGNSSKANEYAQTLLQETSLDRVLESETLSLLGRLAKDRYERTPSAQKTKRRKLAEESAVFYTRGAQVVDNSFPLINAATMSLLAGHKMRAHELARQAIEHAQNERNGRSRKNDAWLLATLGEAFLVLGELSASANWYRKAAQAAAGRRGDLSSMRRNITLLQEKIEGAEIVKAIFHPGRVVAFLGETQDFLEEENLSLRAAIKERLSLLDANIGYCWPTPGANTLFAELLLERGGELHLIVPAERDNFGSDEIDLAAPEAASWRERCDKLLECATQVHVVTRENFLNDSVLFDFAADVTQGLALTHAREMDAPVCVLAAIEDNTPVQEKARQSSTRLLHGNEISQFVARWNTLARTQNDSSGGYVEKAQIIEIARLLPAETEEPAQVSAHSGNLNANQGAEKTARKEKQRSRHVRAMLFADVKNFSKLREEQTPAFFVSFLGVVAREIAASSHQPVFANTWGDGLFLVFENPTSCADFALRLLERIERTDWTKFDLPPDTTIRMGIHAGPVYATQDKIIGRTNFFGAHVNRAARIEPVTTPGCAFTTDQFASLLAIEAGESFRCEYVGVEDLAKGYDRCVLYRLSRF